MFFTLRSMLLFLHDWPDWLQRFLPRAALCSTLVFQMGATSNFIRICIPSAPSLSILSFSESLHEPPYLSCDDSSELEDVRLRCYLTWLMWRGTHDPPQSQRSRRRTEEVNRRKYNRVTTVNITLFRGILDKNILSTSSLCCDSFPEPWADAVASCWPHPRFLPLQLRRRSPIGEQT